MDSRHFGVPALLLALAAMPHPALAHKLNVFARVEGKTIHGSAYFRGGTAVRNVSVTALDPAGRELGRTTTDAEGNFVIEPRVRCDHKLVVDTGDGHGGEYVVRAAELPEGLPPGDGSPPADEGPEAVGSAAAGPPVLDAAGDPGLRAEIQALNRELARVRVQLNEYEDRVRFRDVLGAIGYILGLAGVAYYILGIKRRGP